MFFQVRLLSFKFDHKNIIKLYHSWIVTEKDEISVNFITEACAQTLKKCVGRLVVQHKMKATTSWGDSKRCHRQGLSGAEEGQEPKAHAAA